MMKDKHGQIIRTIDGVAFAPPMTLYHVNDNPDGVYLDTIENAGADYAFFAQRCYLSRRMAIGELLPLLQESVDSTMQYIAELKESIRD